MTGKETEERGERYFEEILGGGEGGGKERGYVFAVKRGSGDIIIE